ncbi:MAG: phytase [Pseudomonadota bacterium]
MLKPFHLFSIVALGIAAACATIPAGDPAVTVLASAETVPVGTINEDAADDPAIWRNAADPMRSLIVGTDKKAGLHVYNLKGEQLSFLEGAGLNNVDLVELADGRVLVAASDRADLATAHIHLSLLDTQTGKLSFVGRRSVGVGEGYGICIAPPSASGTVQIFSAPKEGFIYSTIVSLDSPETVQTTLTTVPSQPEGCVVDARTGTLYIGEEAAGIWAIDMESGTKQLVAATGSGMLVPDVEGLALAAEGEEGGYLVASSQGDNAFAVYRLPDMVPLGRFQIGVGAFGSVEETDGIELDPRSFGPDFPGGLFVAQDGVNPPNAQNFKMVRWDEVLTSLQTY